MMLSGKYGQVEVTAITKMERQSLEIRPTEPDWVEHFSEFLDRPPSCNPPEILQVRNDLPICRDAPTRREIVNAINKLNSGEASGLDKIPPEALTVDASTTADLLHPLFTKVWNNNKFPNDWKKGPLVKVSRKETSPNLKLLYYLFLVKFSTESYSTG